MNGQNLNALELQYKYNLKGLRIIKAGSKKLVNTHIKPPAKESEVSELS
jgi:hypothetical protein